MTDRLSALDTSFLHLESPTTQMHIASLAVYEGGPAPAEEIREGFERRLHLIPRFRQRVAGVPFGGHRPVWVDDPCFDIDDHLQHISLPSPGDDAALKGICGRLLSTMLDRTRPLWEMWLIDGLSGGRFAILSKTHHAMWDGISGADAHAILLDATPEPVDPEPELWQPAAPPGPLGLITSAVADRVRDSVDVARGLVSAVRSPARTIRDVATFASGAGALAAAGLKPAPHCALNIGSGTSRSYEFLQASLDDVKFAKQALGATVNDVALASVTGAMRRWIAHRGSRMRSARAMVPVSVRGADEAMGGNRVVMLLVPLPVAEPDPRTRLEEISARMQVLKSSPMVAAGETITKLAAFVPPQAVATLTRLQSQRLFNLLVTNVPGPPFPLYLRGRRLQALYPQAPLSSRQGLAVGLMSYAGTLGLGLLADRGVVADLDRFAAGLDESLRETIDLASPPASVTQRGDAVARSWARAMRVPAAAAAIATP